MLQNKFTPQELLDSLGPMPGGMNADLAPLILPKDQLSFAVNVTTRRSYVHPRPPFQIRKIDSAGKALLATAFAAGAYQGGGYYNPDVGPEVLIASIAGRLFKFNVTLNPVTIEEISRPGDLNPATEEQVWMWQAEKYMIINDGVSLPLIYNGSATTRSGTSTVTNFSEKTTASFVTPNVGAVVTGVAVSSDTNMDVGDLLSLKKLSTGSSYGTFIIQRKAGGNVIDLVNQTGFSQITVPANSDIEWTHLGTTGNLPAGRMGAYGMGRNWICLVDGKQFIASDIVGGSSGTASENYRDAVLKVTENAYLAGGGYFTVPGSVGDIRAMCFAATLDSSLGQGPLQVFTHSHVFSCQTPVDRLTWQDVTNPILTQSLITNGALGQYSTIVANSDILFRSIDGIRSLILARRDFNTWGNVPQSAEVDAILSQDSTDLLRFGSGMIWDNRMLMTARPTPSDLGFYHSTIISLDFDPISSLRGKLPSVYDGAWTGLNILQMITGEFEEVPRAFSFNVNLDTQELEIYEFLKSETPQKDNGTRDILMDIQSASIFRYPDEDPKSRDLKRLLDGEIYVDQIPPNTTANFQVYYKPDQWPCWVPWFQWSECAGPGSSEQKPQFRPRMGLGEPSPIPCDETNNRPLRLGYTFQVRIIFSNCRFLGARFRSVTVSQQEFAKQICLPLCPPT